MTEQDTLEASEANTYEPWEAAQASPDLTLEAWEMEDNRARVCGNCTTRLDTGEICWCNSKRTSNQLSYENRGIYEEV